MEPQSKKTIWSKSIRPSNVIYRMHDFPTNINLGYGKSRERKMILERKT